MIISPPPCDLGLLYKKYPIHDVNYIPKNIEGMNYYVSNAYRAYHSYKYVEEGISIDTEVKIK